ncbi:MAG: DUF362 domain-containing protein [Acetobacteraceae bacterium]|nr:DUF362 domain-containing protein [Acetobacteraceae bacterium]
MAITGVPPDRPRVAVVKRDKVPGGLTLDYSPEDLAIVKEMVQEAVDLATGGIEHVVFPGDRVVIKPNILFPVAIKWGICTDPRVIEALIMVIRERVKPVQVFVAENAAMNSSTMASFDAAGITQAARRAGAVLIPLEHTSVVEVEIPKAKYWVGDNPKVFRALLDADVVINVPKMKTHFQTCNVTLGLKNWNGILPFGPGRDCCQQQQQGHMVEMDQKFADLYRAVKPSLTVVDGIIGMEGQGPFAGELVDMNLIIAGTDTVAVDAVAATIMGFDPLVDIGTTRICHHEGLGVADLARIEVVGRKVEEVRRPFKRPSWDAVGVYPTVHVYGRGGCPGCLAPIRVVIDYFNMMGKLELVPPDYLKEAGNLVFLEGKGPFPHPEAVPIGKVFIVGDCVPESVVETYRKVRPSTFVVRGCAPMHAWIPIADELAKMMGRTSWPAWTEQFYVTTTGPAPAG